MTTSLVPRDPLAAQMPAIKKLQQVADEMKGYFIERDEIIDCMNIALLARAHTLLIGPPGSGKSMQIECLTSHLEGYKMFSWQVTKFSTPEEIFGPYSLDELKRGNYVRNTAGKLPEAYMAYIDEVFNANSSILNALNSLMNERIFEGKKCPLECMFGATNFIPDDKVLVAFFDRFLFRFMVDYVHDESAFKDLLCLGSYMVNTSVTAEEIADLQSVVASVDVSKLAPKLAKLWALLRVEGLSISDRRWIWAKKAIQAKAVLEGRDFATDDDLDILQHILWSDPKEVPIVLQKVLMVIDPASARLKDLWDQANDIKKSLDSIDPKSDGGMQQIIEGATKLKTVSDNIESIARSGATSERVRSYALRLGGEVEKLRTGLSEDKLGMFGLALK